MNQYEHLVNHLTKDLGRVNKLNHLGLRSFVSIIFLLCIGLIAIYLSKISLGTWQIPKNSLSIINFVISIATASTALLNMFKSMIPGYRINYTILILCIILNALTIGMQDNYIGHFNHGLGCYFFVVISGMAILCTIFLFIYKYKYKSLTPIKTLTFLTISTIFLSFSLLSLCHAYDGNLIDLFMHGLGALTLSLFSSAMGYNLIKIKTNYA